MCGAGSNRRQRLLNRQLHWLHDWEGWTEFDTSLTWVQFLTDVTAAYFLNFWLQIVARSESPFGPHAVLNFNPILLYKKKRGGSCYFVVGVFQFGL